MSLFTHLYMCIYTHTNNLTRSQRFRSSQLCWSGQLGSPSPYWENHSLGACLCAWSIPMLKQGKFLLPQSYHCMLEHWLELMGPDQTMMNSPKCIQMHADSMSPSMYFWLIQSSCWWMTEICFQLHFDHSSQLFKISSYLTPALKTGSLALLSEVFESTNEMISACRAAQTLRNVCIINTVMYSVFSWLAGDIQYSTLL